MTKKLEVTLTTGSYEWQSRGYAGANSAAVYLGGQLLSNTTVETRLTAPSLKFFSKRNGKNSADQTSVEFNIPVVSCKNECTPTAFVVGKFFITIPDAVPTADRQKIAEVICKTLGESDIVSQIAAGAPINL